MWIVLLLYDSDNATPFEKPAEPMHEWARAPFGPPSKTPQQSMTAATTDAR